MYPFLNCSLMNSLTSSLSSLNNDIPSPSLVEKILNKRKIRGVEKYLVYWKRFTVKHDTWEKKEDLGNAKEVLEEFEERMNVEIRR